jgi:hydroxymethylpyrimidine pyrophosphatase-like HAD family hydrolase
MLIAVDFDGTIVEHRYPAIGKVKLFAFDTLKALQKQGHQLILWTFRSGKELDEAVEFCRKNGIEFYAVNKSYPEEEFTPDISRKINADLFIDDRNLGGFIGWGEVWHMINNNASEDEKMRFDDAYSRAEKKTFCGFIKRLFCKEE